MPKQAKFAFVACAVMSFAVASPCFSVDDRAVTTGVRSRVLEAQHQAAQQHPTEHLTPLTLASAVELMLAQNQQLQAQQHALAATRAEGQQFAVRPNPELNLVFEDIAGSGDYSGSDAMQSTLSVSQLVELGGKRVQRQKVARQQRLLAEQQLSVTRSKLICTTTERFVAVLVAQKQLALAQKQLDQAAEVLAIVNEGVLAGKKAPIETLRFKALATEAQIRYQRAIAALDNSRAHLASSWNSFVIDFTAIEGDLRVLPALPQWENIEQQLDSAPLVILRQRQRQLAQAELDLQRANRVSNVTFEVGLKHDSSNDDTAVSAGVTVPLALFDRNQWRITAANLRVTQADAEANALRQQQRQQVLTAYRNAALLRQEIEALTSDLIPSAQDVFQALSYGYAQGKFGVTEVLDAQERLFASEERYIEALTLYHQQVSELSRLLGSAFIDDKG